MTAPTRLGRRAAAFARRRSSCTVVDLGMSPLCESFLPADQIEEMEPFYPLHVRACERCWLVQLAGIRRP